MDCIVQWATILSPIIAVVIAWWVTRCSSKDVAKQIKSFEENTNRQIENIKKVAEIQLDIAITDLQKEQWAARQKYIESSKKTSDALENHFEAYNVQQQEILEKRQAQKEKENNLIYEEQFHLKNADAIGNSIQTLKTLKNNLLNN